MACSIPRGAWRKITEAHTNNQQKVKKKKKKSNQQGAAVLLPGHRRLLLLLLRLLLKLELVCCCCCKWLGGCGAGVRFTMFCKCFYIVKIINQNKCNKKAKGRACTQNKGMDEGSVSGQKQKNLLFNWGKWGVACCRKRRRKEGEEKKR